MANTPLSYVSRYYNEGVWRQQSFRELTQAWREILTYVRGPEVLNAGCGPQLFDYLPLFGESPTRYVGIDVNSATFEYLEKPELPALRETIAFARDRGIVVEQVCADIQSWECPPATFDSVLGVGFFGTFAGQPFHDLMIKMHRLLKPNGRLVKVTWHGPHRTPEETALKLKYRFDNVEETAPDVLLRNIKLAGFKLLEEKLLTDIPAGYRWDAVQACAFEKV